MATVASAKSNNSVATRCTSAHLRKYEEAAVVGQRAKEISEGAPVLIPLLHGEDDAVDIARKELQAGVLKGIITRYHADGTFEHWKLSELLPVKAPIDTNK